MTFPTKIAVLLRETGLEDAAAAAERLRTAVAGVALEDHPDLTVTTSAGVAARHSTMAHYTGLVHQADKALYEAKRLGRNRVAVDKGPGALAGKAETLFHGEPDPSHIQP